MAIPVLIIALVQCFTCDVVSGICERSWHYKNNCEKQVTVSCDGLLVMICSWWQLEILVASCCMSYYVKGHELWTMGKPMKGHEIIRIIVKTWWKLYNVWPRCQKIASKVFSMWKLLFQVIANNLNVNRRSIASELITCNMCGAEGPYVKSKIWPCCCVRVLLVLLDYYQSCPCSSW